MTIVFYGETPFGAELNRSAHYGKFTPVYQIQVSVQVGDLIDARASACFTNPIGRNALCSTSIIISKSALAVADTLNSIDGGDWWGIIARDSGLNISADMHHWTPDRSGILKSAWTGDVWVSFVVYWDADWGLDGIIEHGYGKLIVKTER